MLKFRSKFERTIYDQARSVGRYLEYEPDNVRISYTRTARYIPDFVLPNGVIIEAKGYFKPSDRTKMLRVKESNPKLDIRFVFQRASNRLTKSPNSMTYGEWCDRHDFLWAEGKIPAGWWQQKKSK